MLRKERPHDTLAFQQSLQHTTVHMPYLAINAVHAPCAADATEVHQKLVEAMLEWT